MQSEDQAFCLLFRVSWGTEIDMNLSLGFRSTSWWIELCHVKKGLGLVLCGPAFRSESRSREWQAG